MDFKKWLTYREEAIGPPPDAILNKENPGDAGVGAFPTYSKDEEPPTSAMKRMRRRMKR